MFPATEAWLNGLRAFASGPRPDRSSRRPSPDGTQREHAAERAILEAWLESWLEGAEALAAARRAWLEGPDAAAGGDPEPAIVLTTSPVGIESARLRLDGLAVRIVAVSELDYRLWCIRQPDHGHRWHVNVWNWIKTRVPERRHAEFARHPLAEGEHYWLHRAGVAGAGAADRRESHLWKWDGSGPTLLEPLLAERGVAGLD